MILILFWGYLFPNIQSDVDGLHILLLPSISIILIPSVFRIIYNARDDLPYKDHHQLIWGAFIIIIIITFNMFSGMSLFIGKIKHSKEDEGYLVTQFMEKRYIMSCDKDHKGTVFLHRSSMDRIKVSVAKNDVISFICDNKKHSFKSYISL